MSSKWLCFCLSSRGFQRLLWEHAGFSAQPGIYLGTLANFKLPVPCQSEQQEIVEFIEREISLLDSLTSEATRAIDLLKERRTALISAAVTGKIDVRGVAPAQAIEVRECELDAALAEARTDLAAGRFVEESAAEHLARLDKLA